MKKEAKKLSLDGLEIISFTTSIKGGTEPIDQKEDKSDKIATDTKIYTLGDTCACILTTDL